MLKRKRDNNKSGTKKKTCAIDSCVVGDEKAYNAYRNPPNRNEDGKELDATGSIVEYYKVPVAGSKTLLTSLIQKIRLHFFLVRICDKDLARKTQNDITPEEILVDPEKLDDPELKDYFQILAKYYREINCDQTGCLLKDWNFYMYYQFSKDKQKVCILPEEDDTDNQNFSIQAKQTGLPVYFSDGVIEIAYKPDTIKLIDNENLDQKINNLKLSQNLINDLQKLRISRLDKLHLEQYGYYTDLKDKTEEISILNNLFDTINNDKILMTMQISTLLKKKDSTQLENIWKDTIDDAKYLDDKQKDELHKLKNLYEIREERIASLRQPPLPKRPAKDEDINSLL
ncbi:23535_t:CDS:2, partial [Racocetra persica]